MVKLTRTVRVIINPPPHKNPHAPHKNRAEPPNEVPQRPRDNGFAGVPVMHGFARFYELDVACAGQPDPTTGYLVNIKTIDHAVRGHAVPILEAACRDEPGREPATVLPEVLAAIGSALPVSLERVRLHLSPYHSVEMADDARDTVVIRQKFDFAASHRLHVDSLSDDENRRVFGKCNNPSGHGHNYVVEPTVSAPVGGAFGLARLEQLTLAGVIDRFDHKNLSVDCEEFAALNPSVEHIAKVCFELLSPEIADAGAKLVGVTVWETDRTSCTYPG